MKFLLETFFLTLVGVFYRVITTTGQLPPQGPVIVVANHPNGLLDPLVIRLALGKKSSFLAKSPLFDYPILKNVLAAFTAIPVYRAGEADTRKNEITFSRCDTLLRNGGWLALFPEGISHDFPHLAPLKTGAARIALRALSDGGPDVHILPVGILYEDKDIFRSRVSVALGQAFSVKEWLNAHPEAPVDPLTDRIAQGLSAVVLEAQSTEIWEGLLAVAAWTHPDGGKDLSALHARAHVLAQDYKHLSETQPEALQAIIDATRKLITRLQAVGISDPLALETGLPTVLGSLAPLILLAPFALCGALLGWIPYRLVRPLAIRLAAGQIDVISTYKTLLGIPVIGMYWLIQAIVIGLSLGWPLALALSILAPLTGMIALRWDERFTRRRDLLRAGWLTITQKDLSNVIMLERQELVELISHVSPSK